MLDALPYAPPLERFLRDPTVLFTAAVWLVPLVFLESVSAGVMYLLTPTLWLSFVYLGVVFFATHSSKCIQLNDRDFRVANWFLMNGVHFNLFLDVVSGQWQLSGEMSRQYLVVEPRYQLGALHDAGASVFMTSMLEVFFQSPLCILTYYAFHKGLPFRRATEIIVCILHSTGVWYFYVPEVLGSFRHLNGWPTSFDEALSFNRLVFFWFGFWFCGLLWLYVPFQIGRTAFLEICDACQGYQPVFRTRTQTKRAKYD